ncbi:MAG: hypothetical protein P8Z80_16410 [Pseudolabrys sp.]
MSPVEDGCSAFPAGQRKLERMQQRAARNATRLPEMSNADPEIAPEPAEIRAALADVLASQSFSKSAQLTNFLRFVVEETLAGRGKRIKAYTIATDALGRDETFDPQADPIVRVEAARLRRALRTYYADGGAAQSIVIELPTGTYAPVFHTPQRTAAGSSGRMRQAVDDAFGFAHTNRRLLLAVFAIAIFVSLTVEMLEELVFHV